MMKKMLVIICILLACGTNEYTYAESVAGQPYVENAVVQFNDILSTDVIDCSETKLNMKEVVCCNEIQRQTELQGFECEGELLKEIVYDTCNSDGEVFAVAMQSVYVENWSDEHGEMYSRLLSDEEVSTYATNMGSDTDGKGKLTVTLKVVKNANLDYTATVGAIWSQMGSDGSTHPSSGEDGISIFWGGNFNSTKNNITSYAESFNGTQIDVNNSAYVIDAGRIWTFEDRETTSTNDQLKEVTVSARFNKNNAQGEKTSVTANYIHTYSNIAWSFSLDTSGNIAVSPSSSSKYWKLPNVLEVNNIPC